MNMLLCPIQNFKEFSFYSQFGEFFLFCIQGSMFICFGTGYHMVGHTGLELTIQPQAGHELPILLPPQCWDCSPVLLDLLAVGMTLNKQVLDLSAENPTRMIRRINDSSSMERCGVHKLELRVQKKPILQFSVWIQHSC